MATWGGAEIPLSPTTNTSKPQLTEQSATTPGEMYRSRVWEDLRKLFQQDHLTDVMLAAEGRSIPCHKVLLAAASKFFFDKFITNPESLEHNILDIEDIDFDTLTSVVSYIYSGNIELTVEKTEKLIPAGVSLMLPELTKECEKFFEERNWDLSDCVAVYKIANANSLENAAKKAWDVMLENVQDITTTSAFKELSESEILKYIGDTELDIANEDPVFEAIVTWVRHNIQNRKDRFETLLEHVTLSHCSLSFHTDVIMREPLMKLGNCMCREAEALAAQALSKSKQRGTPRKVRSSDTSLVAMYEGYCWVLRNEEWWSDGSVKGTNFEYSRKCRVGDGILNTGGLGLYNKPSTKCFKLAFPTLNCTDVSDLNVARRSHASVCVGGQVYVLGGLGDAAILQSVEYLRERTGSWCVTTDMPVALYDHTAVSFKQYIYVFGGPDHTDKVPGSRNSFIFDTVSNTWKMKADMPQHCVQGSSVLYKDIIYVLGGREKCCMSYNPDQDQWQTHCRPREDHRGGSAVVWRDRILLCGGSRTPVIEEYNPGIDTWSEWECSFPIGTCEVYEIQLCLVPNRWGPS